MQKRSFRSGNTFSYMQATALLQKPRFIPDMGIFLKKAHESVACFLLRWKKPCF